MKIQSKTGLGLVALLALGIVFSCATLVLHGGGEFAPRIAEDNGNDWPTDWNRIMEGLTEDSLSATDEADWWKLPSQDIYDVTRIVLTSEAGTDFELATYLGQLTTVYKNESTPGRAELVLIGFKPTDIGVLRISGDGWYKLELTIIRRNFQTPLMVIFTGILILTVALLVLAYTHSRGARTYLERFEKMRKPVFIGIVVPGMLILAVSAYLLWDLLMSNTVLQNLWVMPNPLVLVSTILTIGCILVELVYTRRTLKQQAREPYIVARNAALIENGLDPIDIVGFAWYLSLSRALLGELFNAGTFVNALMFIVVCRIVRKFMLAFFGRSYGVLSFRKGDRIDQVFREKYGQFDDVPLGTVMTDFHFNPKHTQRAEAELATLIQKKTIPGEYDPGAKTYFPQGSYSTKRALEKMTGEQRQRLLELVQKEGKIDLARVKESVGLGETDIKGLIFDLVGDGKFEGKFSGNEFILTSDIGSFIAALDTMFSEWGATTKAGEGKKVD